MSEQETTPREPLREQPLSTLLPPEKIWWKRLGPDERTWLTVAFIWCLILFAGMLIWRGIGEQQTPVESYAIDRDVFRAEVDSFIEEHQIGEDGGVPVVAPAPGDVYLQASQFQFRPILQLEAGQTYRLLVSSTDVQHGLSLLGVGPAYSLNFQVLPNYLYVIRITPPEAGEYSLVCNEYCGLGHHVMTGKIIVVEPGS